MPDELLDVVDEADRVTGQAPRSTVHELGLLHRGVHVLLLSPNGDLLVQKRSAQRRQYASLLDCSTSEHVKAGESYEQAAGRGLLEELHLQVPELKPLVKFKLNYGLNDNEISVVFEGRTGSTGIEYDPVEIESIQWMGEDDLKDRMEKDPGAYCGWFREIMNRQWGKPSALHILEQW
jgi:16S rRNA (adenine1518-N6/adenine1519-N6)-dimethyltransferase